MKILKRLLVYLSLAVIILGSYSFIEAYWIQEKHIRIADNKIPPQFENTRIVFISDIHHGPYFSLARLRDLVKRVNGLAPDLILLGGDYVYSSADYIEPCFNELKNLQAPLGVYGVLGNHDHWKDAPLTRQSMAGAGVHLLDNMAYWIEKGTDRIKLGGVGDFYEDIQDLEPTISDVSAEDFVILVSHHPDYVEQIKTDKIDVVFAGHTHGGQVTIFGVWTPFISARYGQKYRAGIVETPYTKVIISQGIGPVVLPIRLCARPQIIVVELSREHEQ